MKGFKLLHYPGERDISVEDEEGSGALWWENADYFQYFFLFQSQCLMPGRLSVNVYSID